MSLHDIDLDEAAAQVERENTLDREIFEKTKQAAAEWVLKWPNHCKACGGWGGSTFLQSHPYGMGSASESLFEQCSAIEKYETCHRCGQDGLTEDGNGPCRFCGWDYDDGSPQVGS